MRALLLLVPALFAGCLRPGEEQADLDREVGRASIAEASIAVDGGTAAVRALTPGAITLWAGGPTIEADLTVAEAGRWTLTVQNALPEGRLTVDSAMVGAPTLDGPTKLIWQLDLAAGAHRLRLAADDVDSPGAFRFAVLSDIQSAIDEVEPVIARLNAEEGIRFVASTGDLTENGEPGQLDKYQRLFSALKVPFYATPGNHERGEPPKVWHDYYGRANHSFVFKGARLTFIDSSYGTLDPIVHGWLDDWLAAARDGTHLVFTHIPLIDPVGVRGGGWRSRKEAAKTTVRLARGAVDGLFFGHIHSYYAFSKGGIPAYISGGGGALPERLDGIERHFLTVDVDADGVQRTAIVRVD
ncbi:MAG: metallophosphoesterase [Myxococcales bacterium]|nr:metallophosphoesterase [Myxococcales bacterium]